MFKPEKFIIEKVRELQERIKGAAIIGISGGVDSTTAAILVNRAIGKNLRCVLVDTGYMRKNEIANNKEMFKKLGQPADLPAKALAQAGAPAQAGLNVRVVDAQQRFYDKLKGVTEPEKKRKIIGELFIRVFEEVAREDGTGYFIQGTIAPDWIESGGGLRDTIKSHHNVGGLPAEIGFEIVEPLRDLYKDEVRLVGQELGLPPEIYEKQPFPGPGLAVRIIGEPTPENAQIVREACAIVEEEIEQAVQARQMNKPWQYFAVLLPVKAVGVHGDVRAYGNIIVVRAVESIDAMSAAYSKIPYQILEKISVRLTNTLKDHISRVVFDITNKPPGTIEYE